MFRVAIIYLLLAACNLTQAGNLSVAAHTETQTTFVFSPNLSLHLHASAFDATKHQVRRCKVLDWEGVCLIDGRPVIGTDWEVPKSVLDHLELEVDGRRVPLDVSSLYNPWVGSPSQKFFCVSSVEGGWVVRGLFSDGAGGYGAEWLVIDGSSLRTRISMDESFMEQFPCGLLSDAPLTLRSSGTPQKRGAP